MIDVGQNDVSLRKTPNHKKSVFLLPTILSTFAIYVTEKSPKVPLCASVTLFASLPLMLTLLVLLACNSIAFIVLLIVGRSRSAGLALLTGVLMLASLIFTDWGFSMPNPRIRISWLAFVPACISQLVLVTMPLQLWRRNVGSS